MTTTMIALTHTLLFCVVGLMMMMIALHGYGNVPSVGIEYAGVCISSFVEA